MPYDSYESSIAYLKKGFRAIKYNFSDGVKKAVTVYLTPTGECLKYKSVKTERFDFLKPTSGIGVKDMISFMYGGLSSTFKRHQKENYSKINKRRWRID